MTKKSKTNGNITSLFVSSVDIDGQKYVLKTENLAGIKSHMVTTVSHEGKTISETKKDYSMSGATGEFRLQDVMLREHQRAIASLRIERMANIRQPDEYLDELNELIRKRNKQKALDFLNDAMLMYPNDPFLLSYYGCLDAIVNGNHRKGIETCKASFGALKEKLPFGEIFFLPMLYLNLGRAYLAAGKKKNAIGAFNKGLDIDAENEDILWELKKLGARKKVAVPLLGRSNPINKYIGMLVHKLGK
ncbi:MAG: hypothetical protein JSV21_04230 [Nitrospirota bacterium]|nr:MAG: hypothetical protein JSV21_04230 [Nitrospirota bacterium]